MPYLETAQRSKDKTIGKYKPKIKKFFTAQTMRILERYNDYLNLPKLSGDDILTPRQVDPLIDYLMPDIENQLLAETMKPMHTSGTQKAIEDINKLSGASVSSALTNAQVVSGLQVLGQRITRINQTTKAILKDVVMQGVENGDNIFAIANSIQDTGIDEFYKGRSLAIARTETRMAYDLGGRIAYKELGVEKFDIVGCVSVMPGENDLGISPGYGSETNDKNGTCGSLDVPMQLWDRASSLAHINHQGVMVASIIPI